MEATENTLGMLVWTLPVRLVDISRGGCRVEVDRHLAAGTSGQLQLELSGVVHLDDVRVSRCNQRAGASRVYQLGIELLRTRRLSRRSLRVAMRRIIGEANVSLGDAPQAPGDRAALDGRKEHQKQGVSRSPPLAATVET
jgi:hypothetical protein